MSKQYAGVLIAHVSEVKIEGRRKNLRWLVMAGSGFQPIIARRAPLAEVSRYLIGRGVSSSRMINQRTGKSAALCWRRPMPLAHWAALDVTEADGRSAYGRPWAKHVFSGDGECDLGAISSFSGLPLPGGLDRLVFASTAFAVPCACLAEVAAVPVPSLVSVPVPFAASSAVGSRDRSIDRLPAVVKRGRDLGVPILSGRKSVRPLPLAGVVLDLKGGKLPE